MSKEGEKNLNQLQEKLTQEEIDRCKTFIAGVDPDKRTRLIFNLFGIFRQTRKDLPLKEYLEPEDYQRFISEAKKVITEYGNHHNTHDKIWNEYWEKRKEEILKSFSI